MQSQKTPMSLRMTAYREIGAEIDPKRVATVACLLGAASASSAQAQDASSALPPVTVDAPKARPRPAAAKPGPAQLRARAALRRQARQRAAAPVVLPQPTAPSASLPILAQGAPDGDPYANAAAPYQADRLASPKFTEPLLNTPKTVTVLTKDVIRDKTATSLKDLARSTAGVTLGTGEGGNAFGDRFFIRGFDARNDVFVDGIRDPGVSVRENFFTDQVEILRGPASSYAGRGTAGGAINIVTKQAQDRDFKVIEAQFGTDATKRVTIDVNQVVSPDLSVRAGGLFQDAGVAGRNVTTDDRNGAFGAIKYTPTDQFVFKLNYVHSNLSGIPDFGVPYYRPSTATTAGGPFPEFGLNRNTFYGFANRDFLTATQDFGTASVEGKINDSLSFSSRLRLERSDLSYIGTLAENPNISNPNPALWTVSANPQSRNQVTTVIANQNDLTYKFDTGPVRNTLVGGTEISRESVEINSFTGLASEALPGGFSGSGSLPAVNLFNPQYTYLPFSTTPSVTAYPTNVTVDTKSVYLIDTANYNDRVILNGGVRYDDYGITSAGYSAMTAPNTFGVQSAQSGLFNWNVGLTLKPLPIMSLYAAYATSSNPVGSELDGLRAQYGALTPVLVGNPNQIFGPELNRAAEVGTKWELFNGRLLATAALFHTTKDNARESQNQSINGQTVSVISAGAAYYVQGVDLELAGKITDEWSVFGGLVLMQSAVTKSLVPPADALLYKTNIGLPLANIAHQSFNLLTKYKVLPWLEVGGQATYVSRIYGGTFLAANQGTSIPDHWRFDTFAEAKLTDNITAKLAVNNIFNELYYDALYQSAAPFVLEAPGRAAYLILTAKF